MAATFREFAATVLAQRDEDGIRGIGAERNRFAMHISESLLAPMALPEIRPRHVRDWLREMAKKNAQDSRGERKLTTETIKRRFCSNLVSGVLGRRWTLEEIRPLAGHSSITVTERYAHIGETEILKAAGETTFAHGPLMPLAKATERDVAAAANDTERDVSIWDWDDEAVAS